MKTKNIALLGLFVLSFAVSAQSIKTGQDKAAACQGCHGVNGVSVNGIGPHLAGQTARY
jgi:cytochrome c2